MTRVIDSCRTERFEKGTQIYRHLAGNVDDFNKIFSDMSINDLDIELKYIYAAFESYCVKAQSYECLVLISDNFPYWAASAIPMPKTKPTLSLQK